MCSLILHCVTPLLHTPSLQVTLKKEFLQTEIEKFGQNRVSGQEWYNQQSARAVNQV